MLQSICVRYPCALVVLMIVVVLSVGSSVLAQPTVATVFVDVESTAANPDGSSWSTAFPNLWNGILKADDLIENDLADEVEIWVADGWYYPDRDLVFPEGTGSRSRTFNMRTNVRLYAGFQGLSHPSGGEPETTSGFLSRNPYANLTVLSGNILDPEDETDNSYHVVTAIGVNSTGVLDGFVIRDGYAFGAPAGAPHLEQNSGGGLYSFKTEFEAASQPVITRCRFINNKASLGGAANCSGGAHEETQFINCEFLHNSATGDGGAVYQGAATDDNLEPGPGGCIPWARCRFVNCLFAFNELLGEESKGGAIFARPYNTSTLTNCTLTRNTTGVSSDGLCAAATIISSIVFGNGEEGVLADQVAGSICLRYSCVEGWVGQDTESCFANISDDPLFVDEDTDFRLTSNSPCINTGSLNAAEIAVDDFDVDQDGDHAESGGDLDLKVRVSLCRVDMGAYEFGSGACPGDVAGAGGVPNCVVNVDDLLAVIHGWGECDPELPCIGDVTAPCGTVNVDDLLVIINGWGPCDGLCLGTVGTGSASMPQSVQDCMNQCNDRCPGDDQCWADCVDGCVAALCAAEIIECDD